MSKRESAVAAGDRASAARQSKSLFVRSGQRSLFLGGGGVLFAGDERASGAEFERARREKQQAEASHSAYL